MNDQIVPVVFDSRPCGLAESPLWLPSQNALYWVDIPGDRIMANINGVELEWPQPEIVSAIARYNDNSLLVARETGLYKFDPDSDQYELLCAVEMDDPKTRSNDGRADPWGGFWVSTMSKEAESGAGSIYRWFKGELTIVFQGITIPNGICFDRNRSRAYFADSAESKFYMMNLDQETGVPISDPEVFLSFGAGMSPDGAVIDEEGNIWCAMFDASAIYCISPEAEIIRQLDTETPRPTCVAFGGKSMSDLFVSTAYYGLEDLPAANIQHGVTLLFSNVAQGICEPSVYSKNFSGESR
jgi:sugar lactone lactonase YvrE